MIDLHCHILPGLDDGPADWDGSLAVARAAAGSGIRTIVATPHIRDDFRFDVAEIQPRVERLNSELRSAGVETEILAGAEVALPKIAELDDEALAGLCLGPGPYLLLESPYTYVTDMLERSMFDVQVRGFRPVLAHPERSPSFLSDVDRVAELVARGVSCSVTAASMSGDFGRTVRRFTVELFRRGLVHNVASDAHDAVRRVPALRHGFEALEAEMPGLSELSGWFTRDAPSAMLQGESPSPPPTPARARRRWPGRFAKLNR